MVPRVNPFFRVPGYPQLRRRQAARAELDGDREGVFWRTDGGDRGGPRGGGDVWPDGGGGVEVGRLLP